MGNQFLLSKRKPKQLIIDVRLRKQKKSINKPVWKEIWHWLCKYPGIASLLLPLFGGLVVLTYLLPLGFLPDFNFSETLGILAAAALLGAISFIIFAGTLLLPASLSESLLLEEKNSQRQIAETMLLFCLWPLFFISGYFIKYIWELGILILLLLLIFLVLLPMICEEETENSRKNAPKYLLLIIVSAVNFLCASLVFIPAAIVGLKDDLSLQKWAALAAWYFTVALFNTILIREKEKIFSRFLIAGIILVGLLMILAKNPIYIHILAIKKLKMGNIQEATITVNASASAVLQAVYPEPPQCAKQLLQQPGTQNMTCTYEKVTILSRLGNQYYLEIPQKSEQSGKIDKKTSKLRVVINKKDVLGWSIQEEIKD